MIEQAAAQGLLADNEFSLIQEIEKRPSLTQRELSVRTGLSLGMTNILLKRLARKGLIKIQRLDLRGTRYLLTVEGLVEKTRKSFAYAVFAFRQFQIVQRRIHDVVWKEYRGGVRRASVVAWPETVLMIEESLKGLGLQDLEIVFVETFKHLGDRPGVAFLATIEPPPRPRPGQRFVPLLEYEALKFKFPG
jgi:DNA-binding MarR family transcriptional regulator